MSLSLQTRIVLVFSALFVIVQLASFTAMFLLSRQFIIDQIGQNLNYASEIFNRLISEEGMRIAGEAGILVADFGFRSAVSDADSSTIDSALENLTYRSRGQRGFYIDLHGKIVSDTAGRYRGQMFMFPDALKIADDKGKTVVLTLLDGELCEIAVTPVLAPETIGWVGIVVKLDQNLVQRFQRLSKLPPEVSIIELRENKLQILSSSNPKLSPEFFQQILTDDAVAGNSLPHLVEFDGKTAVILIQPLNRAMTAQPIVSVLQIELSKAMQAYATLFYTVLALSISGLLIILIGAYLLARSISLPVRQLAKASQQFLDGGLHAELPVVRDDELGRLAASFNLANRMAAEMSNLKEQDQLRRELVASVSHDLRTPLTALNGYLQTMQIKAKTLPEAEKERYLAVAVRQSEKLGRLAQELFELAKLECQAIQLNLETFNIAELIQDVMQKYQNQAAKKLIRIQANLDYPAPMVIADIDLIERVLTNLLDNAIRHTALSGMIDIHLQFVQPRLLIAISDSGEGIAPELLDKLFDRQFAMRHYSKPDSGGMGLLIVAKILALHGGGIRSDSRLGQGARFEFDLATPE